MELLRDTHIDFMKYRKFWIIVSLVLMGIGVFALFGRGRVNEGIDFAGGTQVTLRFRDQPQVDRLRSLLEAAGLQPSIQRFGQEADREVMIKTAETQGSEEGSRERIVAALNRQYNQEQAAGKADLNQIGTEAVTQLLMQLDPDGAGRSAVPGQLP
nr:hypothetical protein [Acidobacteriota bacterium]